MNRRGNKFSAKMLIDLRCVPDYAKIKELADRKAKQKEFIYGVKTEPTLNDIFTIEKELTAGSGFLPIKYQKIIGMSVMGQLPAFTRNSDGAPYPNIRPAIQTYMGDESSTIRNVWKIFRLINNAAAKFNNALNAGVKPMEKPELGEISYYVTLGSYDRKRGVMQCLPSKTFALARSIHDLCHNTFFVGVDELTSQFYDKSKIPPEKMPVYEQIMAFADINRSCRMLFDGSDKWGNDKPNYMISYSPWAIDPPKELAGLDTLDEVDIMDTWNRAMTGDYKGIAEEMTKTVLDNWKNFLLYKSYLDHGNSSGIGLDNEYGPTISPKEAIEKHMVVDTVSLEGDRDPFAVLKELAAKEGITSKEEIMKRHAIAFGILPPNGGGEEMERDRPYDSIEK